MIIFLMLSSSLVINNSRLFVLGNKKILFVSVNWCRTVHLTIEKQGFFKLVLTVQPLKPRTMSRFVALPTFIGHFHFKVHFKLISLYRSSFKRRLFF